MAKRIVNKAERNAERYDAKETGYRLFEDSQNGKTFDRLMPLIVSEQNIILAYRNICKNSGSKTPGTDGKTIVAIQSLPIESVIKTVRNKLNYYQPKKVRRVEIPKDNGKTRPLGIPSIWDRLIQQCILQILEPICEAKFHERNNGFRPYRSTQNAIAQCYKMAQLQNLHFVVDVDIVGFFDNIDHSKLIRQLWGIGIQDRKLIIGGVEIPYEKGLLGHSDADVLLHAIMDALLGAAALGDIGKHFPDNDDRYKGISSLELLRQVGKLLDEKNYVIENIDATIIAQKPKMRPYIDEMRKNIADTLKLDIDRVNVKATTEEGLGFTGTGEGISSQAVCSLNDVTNYIYGDSDMTNCCGGCGGCSVK